MTGERVEVIDPNFRVLETVPRSTAIRDGLRFKLAIVIIKNNKNQFFVHQRKASKKTFPLKWAIGAGGSVRPKESFKEAANRESKEELGVKAKLEYLFDFAFKSSHSHYKAKVFFGIHTGSIKLNKIECEQGKWVTASGLRKMIKQGVFCPDTALFTTKYLDSMRKNSKSKKRLVKKPTKKERPFKRPRRL